MQDNKKKTPPDNGRTITIVISVIIALLLWSYVIIRVNPTQKEPILGIPVQLLNEQSLTARQLAISDDGEYMVDVVVEGRRADIANVKSEDIIAEVDLFGWSKGENYIPVNVKVPPGLEVVEVRSAKIQVTIEDLVGLSKPVNLVYRGEFRGGTEDGEVELRPAEIEITGAKSAVESVREVRVYVDVDDLTEDGDAIQSEAVALNDMEMIVENVKMSSNYVNVFARLFHLKSVPLVVETAGSLNEGYVIKVNAPRSIIIKGPESAIKEVESIRTAPLDITGMTQDGNIALTPLLPEGIWLSKRNSALIAQVDIEEISTKQLRLSSGDILIEGLAQGRAVSTEIEEVLVTVTGRKEVVDRLQPEQLKLYIEVEDLEMKIQTLPILVSTELSLDGVAVEPSEVTISIIDTGTTGQEGFNE